MRLKRTLATGTAAMLLASGGVALSAATAPPAEAAGVTRTFTTYSQYGKDSALSGCRTRQSQVAKSGMKIVRHCYYGGYYYDKSYARWIWIARFEAQTNAF